MKSKIIFVVVLALVLAAGVARAVTTVNITSRLGGSSGSLFQLDGTLKVRSLQVGSQGTGGVTFFNGTIVNNTTTKGANNPVTFGDNVRIDGELYRGSSAGTSDSLPLKINDNVNITGNLTLGGTLAASSVSYSNASSGLAATTAQAAIDEVNNFANLGYKTYVGSFDVTSSGDEVTVEEVDLTCDPVANPTYTKYTRYYWKKIAVPEIDLNNMPSIKVYTRLSSVFDYYPNGGDVWIEMSAYSLAAYTQGYVYILYKEINQLCNDTYETEQYLTGEYKINIIHA